MKANDGSFKKLKCGLNRREFLGGCAVCAAGLAGLSALGVKSALLGFEVIEEA